VWRGERVDWSEIIDDSDVTSEGNLEFVKVVYDDQSASLLGAG